MPFEGIQVTKKIGEISILLENGYCLQSSFSHRVMTSIGWEEVQNLKEDDKVKIESGKYVKIVSITVDPEETEFYDVVGVPNQTYYTNNILSHNCDFLGSQNTLISGAKLSVLTYIMPVHSTEEGLAIFNPPEKDHIYTIIADTSQGKEMDDHAFSVIDCTKFPYVQVARFKNNELSYQVYPSRVKKTAEYYNNAYVLWELNDVGDPAANIMYNELEYTKIVMVTNRGQGTGQVADGGFGAAGKIQLGVRTSSTTKKVGCNVLKDLIEGDKLIIQDFDTINQLSTFIQDGLSYEAAEGHKDDLVATLFIFAWLTTQEYFKDYTNTNIRKNVYADTIRRIEEDVVPFGIIDNGIDPIDGDDGIDIFDERTPAQKKYDVERGWLENVKAPKNTNP